MTVLYLKDKGHNIKTKYIDININYIKIYISFLFLI